MNKIRIIKHVIYIKKCKSISRSRFDLSDVIAIHFPVSNSSLRQYKAGVKVVNFETEKGYKSLSMSLISLRSSIKFFI